MGRREETVIRRGTWSEVNLVRAMREVLGKTRSYALLTKSPSRWTRVGEFLWFDQVKARPRRGISISPSKLIVSLNMTASLARKLEFFLSSRHRARLKSPRIIQGTSSLGAQD